MNSEKWSLNSFDWKKIINNALVFFSPLALIYLAFVGVNIQDGISLSDFVPNNVVIGSLVLYILNVATDFFRKFSKGN